MSIDRIKAIVASMLEEIERTPMPHVVRLFLVTGLARILEEVER